MTKTRRLSNVVTSACWVTMLAILTKILNLLVSAKGVVLHRTRAVFPAFALATFVLTGCPAFWTTTTAVLKAADAACLALQVNAGVQEPAALVTACKIDVALTPAVLAFVQSYNTQLAAQAAAAASKHSK